MTISHFQTYSNERGNMHFTQLLILTKVIFTRADNEISDQICDEVEAEQAIIELHDDLDDDDDGTISTTGETLNLEELSG